MAGPHKTATTYIQSLLYFLRNDLARENFAAVQNEDFVNDSFSPPTNVVFLGHALGSPTATTGNRVISSFHKLMKTHREKKMNVILSSESFDLLTTKESALAQVLHGFKPMVVIVARNWVSMLLSTFFQECRRLDGVIKRCQNIPPGEEVSLLNYLKFNDNLLSNHSVLLHERSALYLADRFARHFGALSIRILDFDGLLASGVNIGESFFSLLDRHTSTAFKESVKQMAQATQVVNPATSLDYVQIIRSAKHRGVIPSDCSSFDGNVAWSPPPNATEPLPKRCIEPQVMQTVLDTSLAVDKRLRHKWGQVMVGGSREAAEEAMRRSAFTDFRRCWVDEKLFFASPYWLKWLQDESRAKCS